MLEFTKMHGLGNDFIIIDATRETPFEDNSKAAVALCDRNFGIGADGIILIVPSEKEDIKMRIFNSDGSEAEMCGNGIRCFAKYVYEKGIIKKTKIKVETLAGVMEPELNLSGDTVTSVRVNMGPPRLMREEIPMIGPRGKVISEPLKVDDTEYLITCVSMGNPHCVIMVEDLFSVSLRDIGPKIENNPLFPQKTNVEFVKVLNPEEIKMIVWERGAGETLACGTGACASVVATAINKKTGRKVVVHLPGGDLFIEWSEDNNVYMTGPAEEVFSGQTNILTGGLRT